MSWIKGPRDPKLNPLWVRLLVVGIVAGWATFEVVMGYELWQFIAGMALFYCVWTLLISYKPVNENEDKNE